MPGDTNSGSDRAKKKHKKSRFHPQYAFLLTEPARRCRVNSQFGGLDVSGRPLDGVAVVAGKLGDDLQQGGAVVLHWLAVAAEPRLVLGTQHRHPRLELWQTVPDVVHEKPAEGFGEVARTGPRGQRGVVALQEGVLVLGGVLQALLGVDVVLAPEMITNEDKSTNHGCKCDVSKMMLPWKRTRARFDKTGVTGVVPHESLGK